MKKPQQNSKSKSKPVKEDFDALGDLDDDEGLFDEEDGEFDEEDGEFDEEDGEFDDDAEDGNFDEDAEEEPAAVAAKPTNGHNKKPATLRARPKKANGQRKRGRLSREDRRIVLKDGNYGYTVQVGYENDLTGTSHEEGEVVPVQCQHCAMWLTKTPYGTQCHPKRRCLDDEGEPILDEEGEAVMFSPDKWSCGRFFISKEFEDLTPYLELPLPGLLLTEKLATVRERMLLSRESILKWFASQIEIYGIEEPEEVFDTAEEFLSSFNQEQINYAIGFFQEYGAWVKSRTKKAGRTPKARFSLGDTIEWTDADTGSPCTGYVAKNAAGTISLICISGPKVGVTLTMKLKYFRSTSSPKLVKKGAQQCVESTASA